MSHVAACTFMSYVAACTFMSHVAACACQAKPRLQALTVERAVSCDDIGASDDDEVGDLEDAKSKTFFTTSNSIG